MEDTFRTAIPDSASELRARALRFLARREYSRSELARKLLSHAESPEALVQLLDTLVGKNQLSDDRFAESRARQMQGKYGSARIRLELRAKGIADATTDRVATTVGKSDLARARAILARKYQSPTSGRQERAKRIRFLQGRGFSMDVIREALGGTSDVPMD
jgi:regulatory protein